MYVLQSQAKENIWIYYKDPSWIWDGSLFGSLLQKALILYKEGDEKLSFLNGSVICKPNNYFRLRRTSFENWPPWQPWIKEPQNLADPS